MLTKNTGPVQLFKKKKKILLQTNYRLLFEGDKISFSLEINER